MGRSNHIDGLFARIGQRDFRGQAFQSLSLLAVKAFFELDISYWESGRINPVAIPCRQLADRLGCKRQAAATALRELVELGFLAIDRPGTLKGSKSTRCSVYRRTWQATNDGRKPSFDFRRRAQNFNQTDGSTSVGTDNTSALPDKTSNLADV